MAVTPNHRHQRSRGGTWSGVLVTVVAVALAACSSPQPIATGSPASTTGGSSACTILKDYPAEWAGLTPHDFRNEPTIPTPACLVMDHDGFIGVSVWDLPADADFDRAITNWRRPDDIGSWTWGAVEVRQRLVEQPALGPFRSADDPDQWKIVGTCGTRFAEVAWLAKNAPPIDSAEPVLTYLLHCDGPV